VLTDWLSVGSTAGSSAAGLDLEMPGPGQFYGAALADAVRAGEVPEAELDEHVAHLLTVFDRIGALDDDPAWASTSIDRPEHRAVARDAAAAAMVLLRNDAVLPFDRSAMRTLAVLGPNAERPQMMGGGSANLAPHYEISLLDALRHTLGDDVSVRYERAADIDRTAAPLYSPFAVEYFANLPQGLVLVTGPTGSGKSTSLAAIIDYINIHRRCHIITIEDPVEYVHPHRNCVITQREVGVDTESFEAALKNSLRQAPDVILMGEIRDRETMEHAVSIAETGHLCLATLHANSSNQALDRIINFFPEERRPQLLLDLSLNLRALVSQRLIPKQDGKGRHAAVEIMINSPLISDLIFKGEVAEILEVMKKSRNIGMQTFDQALFDAYENNIITYEDALRNAHSLNDLRLQIKLSSTRGKTKDLSEGTEAFRIV